jgi:amidase
LGYAALAVPATSVSREKDLPDQEWLDHVPRNAGDRFNKEQCESPSGHLLRYVC